MKIDNIEIKNFKGFEECNVEFHPKLNLFIGNNASGKTTLLKAILKSINNFTSRIVQAQSYFEDLEFSSVDINYLSKSSTILAKFSNFTILNLDFKTYLITGNSEQESIKLRDISYQEVNEVSNIFNSNTQKNSITIPIFKFYPANRGSISYSEVYSNNVYNLSQLETWSNIYQNNLSYSKFFHWFFENETNELRLQRDSQDFGIQSPALRDVRKAVETAFQALNFGNYKLLSKQISRQGNSKLLPTLVLLNLDTKKEEFIDNKSDGEKAIIALVADIAYNLSIAKDFSNDDDFLLSPGIVMIDEIETHLHPKWQREIVPLLTNLFPNIQFFITTHSPQVLSSVNSESIFVCENFKVKNIKIKTKGEDTNSILKYVFNTTDRPTNYIKLLDEFDDLMTNNSNVKDLKKIIEEIELLYDEDSSLGTSNLIEELKIKLSAYEFDKEYEKSN